MTAITKVRAWEVLDSRGAPTVEVEMQCAGGATGRAIVPAGASTGSAEAQELRDGDPDRYDGRGVLQAVRNVEQVIAPALAGMDVADQFAVDARLCELDNSPRKSRLGANAILGASLAAAHAAAAAEHIPLYRHICHLWQRLTPSSAATVQPRIPLPMTNMISGGAHAGGNIDFQDFLIMPVGAGSYAEALEWIVRVFRRLGTLLRDAGYEGRLVGDEGGYGPRLKSNSQAAEFIVRAIEAARLRPAEDVTIAIDVASTQFYDGSHYRLAATGGARLTSQQMIDQLAEIVDKFPVTSIEDGLAEEDWEGWQALTSRLGERVKLVGDDLFATRDDRLRRGISLRAANSVLIKVNQIGTLSETMRTMRTAQNSNYGRVVSARSGETEDTTIADLAVGTATKTIKIGSIQRSERLAKYNRLLHIEDELGSDRINW
ncbi:MAG TPA: phosphopyruvate hydratase [Pirellulales bacterium]|jgi:enolase|nr:phosphopyruvate hydratase [Pirellulales bacterium]